MLDSVVRALGEARESEMLAAQALDQLSEVVYAANNAGEESFTVSDWQCVKHAEAFLEEYGGD